MVAKDASPQQPTQSTAGFVGIGSLVPVSGTDTLPIQIRSEAQFQSQVFSAVKPITPIPISTSVGGSAVSALTSAARPLQSGISQAASDVGSVVSALTSAAGSVVTPIVSGSTPPPSSITSPTASDSGGQTMGMTTVFSLGSPSIIATTAVVTATATATSPPGVIDSTAVGPNVSTTTVILIIVPVCGFLVFIPALIVLFCLWRRRKRRTREARTREPTAKVNEAEMWEQEAELDGVAKQELANSEWVQELGGKANSIQRTEMEVVEAPQELEARRKSQKSWRSLRFSRMTIKELEAMPVRSKNVVRDRADTVQSKRPEEDT